GAFAVMIMPGKMLRNTRGAGAVEFALVSPILLGLLVATMNLGVYFFAKNSVSNALDAAAREAPIHPRPTDADLQSVFEAALLKAETSGTVTLTITDGTTASGVDYVDLGATYSVPIDLIFTVPGSLPASAERRVYLPKV
ncbi:pilus assembly protein, partial [Altererythrobacter sp.]|nr:pilus assembly protein [Altererythrobacter sp.]